MANRARMVEVVATTLPPATLAVTATNMEAALDIVGSSRRVASSADLD